MVDDEPELSTADPSVDDEGSMAPITTRSENVVYATSDMAETLPSPVNDATPAYILGMIKRVN